RLGDPAVELEETGPALGRADAFEDARGAAVPFDVAMGELDRRLLRPGDHEANLDFARRGWIRLIFPLTVEMPRETAPGVRLPDEHSAPLTFAAVHAALVPPSAGPRLDHDPREVRLAEVVRGGPPAGHAFGKNRERAFLRDGDDDGPANDEILGVGGH